MLKRTAAVIFDLDGTLMDSMWIWKDIDIEYLGKYGYTLPDDLQKAIEGMGFTETAYYFKERFSIPESIEEIKREWNEMAFHKYAYEIGMKPGARSFLARLKAAGIRMGIASSNSRELIMECLAQNHVTEYFDCIVTSCEVAKGKPSPDIYLRAAQLLEAEPAECFVFEDVPMGILSGKNAGMKVCAVKDSYSENQRKDILEIADYFISHYDEVDVKNHTVIIGKS